MVGLAANDLAAWPGLTTPATYRAHVGREMRRGDGADNLPPLPPALRRGNGKTPQSPAKPRKNRS